MSVQHQKRNKKCARIIFHLNNYLHLYIKQYKMETLEQIKTLPPELREIIYKDFIKIKLRERKDIGWDEINAAIKEAPICDHNQQIVKVLFCYKCGHCRRNYLCNLCKKKMESDTISAILFIKKMITTSASRNLGMIVGVEPFRDIFSERPETNIFLVEAGVSLF